MDRSPWRIHPSLTKEKGEGMGYLRGMLSGSRTLFFFFDHFISQPSIQIYIVIHLLRSRSRSMDGWVLVMGKVLSDQASFPPITTSLSSSSSIFICFICLLDLHSGSGIICRLV